MPFILETRYKHEVLVDNEPVLYEILDACPKLHLREVTAEEGATLARTFECGFSEVAAAEMVAPVAVVFQELCRAVLASRRKSKHSLLERIMLGTKPGNLRLYVRGKSDSALPKD
ncbi:unnamed protein product [Acanthoscelides obtectus]|uniref:small monomeric GTPase n=1 Tax=Acanthoscelides obtectus TaxID=200917 RepID=A0A9P0KGR1_ACAOB|nr:unnamed protein product [Acanthoscelides obtectus]CAK1645385.1 hypothetical protein AOBTE_LOCUS14099 [Acanthoscelides obtectus]